MIQQKKTLFAYSRPDQFVSLVFYIQCALVEEVRTELMKPEVIPYIPNLREWVTA